MRESALSSMRCRSCIRSAISPRRTGRRFTRLRQRDAQSRPWISSSASRHSRQARRSSRATGGISRPSRASRLRATEAVAEPRQTCPRSPAPSAAVHDGAARVALRVVANTPSRGDRRSAGAAGRVPCGGRSPSVGDPRDGRNSDYWAAGASRAPYFWIAIGHGPNMSGEIGKPPPRIWSGNPVRSLRGPEGFVGDLSASRIGALWSSAPHNGQLRRSGQQKDREIDLHGCRGNETTASRPLQRQHPMAELLSRPHRRESPVWQDVSTIRFRSSSDSDDRAGGGDEVMPAATARRSRIIRSAVIFP